MFAVKGWSVSADKLKPEVASAPAAGSSETKKSKKRKRSGAHSENVTANNVVDLWERVIEHKGSQNQNAKAKAQSNDKDIKVQDGEAESQPKEKKETKDKKDRKRQKLNSDDVPSEKKAEPKVVSSVEKEGQEPELAGSKDEKPSKKDKKDKKDKKEKKDKSKAKETGDASEAKDTAKESKPSTKAAAAAAAVPAPPKLTPLQAAMREKLISARFRHLNETLYTRPSADAFQLFEDSPEMFTEYHEGFRRQVDVWPENPVDSFLAEIRERGRQRDSHRRQSSSNNNSSKAEVLPLPRNRNTAVCTIADLGCGDAGLASGLQAEKRKLKLEVLSFDLHSPHPLVTKADIANLPLASGSVDVAIFCLALMGTNWIDFVEEAYRVLRWKGELWVAEIKSRFGSGMRKGGGGGGGVVEHSVGNRRKAGAAAAGAGGKKANRAKDEAADEKALLVEVDGVDDNRQQTDVSAFVDVLNKRGFMLQGQDQGHGAQAVDLSNKMFVKMRFVKSAPAVKGKCVMKEKEVEERNKLAGKMPMVKKPKFIDDADKDVNEAAVLKPCVYKIR